MFLNFQGYLHDCENKNNVVFIEVFFMSAGLTRVIPTVFGCFKGTNLGLTFLK